MMKARYLLFMLLVLLSTTNARANDANWDYNPFAFQYDMTVYATLSTVDDKSITDMSDFQIAAFCGEECRGIAEEKVVDGHKYLYLRIRSNQAEGEVIDFKVLTTTTGKVAKVAETIDFKSLQTIGYPSSPFAINARNPYSVTFVVDGVEHQSDLFFGDDITAPTDTDKEGHTFVEWTPEVDATVPDHDVTYTATYSVNKYMLTYKVDGEVYKQFETEYNALITPEPAPVKDGYTFSGWSEIPETMPADDVEVTGFFARNVELNITDAGWATFAAPFETTMPTGVTAYIITGVDSDNSTLLLSECAGGIVPAFQPVVVNGEPMTCTYSAIEELNTNESTGILSFASSEEYANVGDYVLQNHNGKVGFYQVLNGDMFILHQWKCFISAESLNPEVHDSVKAFYFNASTAINKLTRSTDTKSIFDMNGRQINKLQKGINIVDGMKIFVK